MSLQFQLLFRRFSVALVLTTLCRFVFWVFTPAMQGFEPTRLLAAFGYGILYDVSACVYLHSLFILLHLLPEKWFFRKPLQRFLFYLFMVVQTLQIFFNFLDTGYYTFSGRRSGLELFAMGKELNGLVISYLLSYWYLVVLLLACIWLQYKLYKPLYQHAFSQPKQKSTGFFREVGIRLVILVLTFIGARGGFNLLPLNTFDAARQTQAALVPLVVNTPFSMLMSIQQDGLKIPNYMSEEEVGKWFDPIHEFSGDKTPRNVVLIIVESLGKEYVGGYNNGKGYTPFLDSLMHYSEVWQHAYANGKKSIEGIPAILSGMPSWMQTPYLSSYYQSNRLGGIGASLSASGYACSFYHGGRNGTMSLDNYIALSGGGDYKGKNEYPNPGDFDGHWGIYDKPFLHWMLQELAQKKEPFFSTVFTLSSHHPYKLPEELVATYPKGTLPIHASIGYADDALRSFFAEAAKMPWYLNTTFVITADHSAENETSYYQSNQGKFEMPLVVFRPDAPVFKFVNETVSHLDIPTIILQETGGFMGKNLSFGAHKSRVLNFPIAIQYHDGFYQAIHHPWVYHFDGKEALSFYRLSDDPLMKNNLVMDVNLLPVRDSIDRVLRATLQTYSTRLIENRTLPD